MDKIDFIITEEQYRAALKKFFELCSSEKSKRKNDELHLLTCMMEKYERANCNEN